MNTGISSAAPAPSMTIVVMIMNLVSLTMPPRQGAEMAFCIVCLCMRLIFLPDSIYRVDATVITPRPPTWISARIITCPKYDQYVAVSTTTRPVTHTADVAVKRAVPNDVNSPLLAEMGSMSSSAPSTMTMTKPSIII